jgi:hypothetical protein
LLNLVKFLSLNFLCYSRSKHLEKNAEQHNVVFMVVVNNYDNKWIRFRNW